jgi:hypothetical protein
VKHCPEKIEGITGLPLPGIKQELRKILDLVRYCWCGQTHKPFKLNLYISN